MNYHHGSAMHSSTLESAMWRAHCTQGFWMHSSRLEFSIQDQMTDFYCMGCENWGSSVEFETVGMVLEEQLNRMRGKGALTPVYDVLDPSV